MKRVTAQSPPAHLVLRAHHPAPARVELVYQPAPLRLLRMMAALLVFWGAIPLLLWVPPHYPWVAGAFCIGLFLAHRCWTGRYRIRAFAGVCPRCGSPVFLGVDRTISLPHTLTCFRCHFEPQLVVSFGATTAPAGRGLEHQDAQCVGLWSTRWLADVPYVICERCHASAPATPRARRAAEAENRRARLLQQLTDEGRPLI